MTIIVAPSVTFNRPANTNAYASGQLIANSTVAGSVVPLALAPGKTLFAFSIRRARLLTTDTGFTAATVRAHFYSALPVPVGGDGAAWNTPQAGYLGFIDMVLDKTFSDGRGGAGAPSVGMEISGYLAAVAGGGQPVNFYALLEARGAITPLSGSAFAFTAEVWLG